MRNFVATVGRAVWDGDDMEVLKEELFFDAETTEAAFAHVSAYVKKIWPVTGKVYSLDLTENVYNVTGAPV